MDTRHPKKITSVTTLGLNQYVISLIGRIGYAMEREWANRGGTRLPELTFTGPNPIAKVATSHAYCSEIMRCHRPSRSIFTLQPSWPQHGSMYGNSKQVGRSTEYRNSILL
ncbi:hypothetical protein EVAR_60202_1 [Eumeta japonica]|uniref:Uncharacterized protein n=1 Tax=Eumeta variegata TaxID=151549 RepID=A0A4C1Z8Q0_EUMVA|nr:hypothetical protein EVAR_60202_1 [Eumeta japonica]